MARLTFNPWLEQAPVWSPDGRQVAFSSNQNLNFSLHMRNADGSGNEQQVADLNVAQEGFWDWSRDGKTLLIRKGTGLWTMSAPDHQVRPWMQERWTIRNAQFSPDGRWWPTSWMRPGIRGLRLALPPTASAAACRARRGAALA
jgi:Tol biopolymer transport system component